MADAPKSPNLITEKNVIYVAQFTLSKQLVRKEIEIVVEDEEDDFPSGLISLY